MNYKYNFSLICFILFSAFLNAQVGINTTNPNAALDVESTDQGVLFPRVALTAANVAAPVTNPNGGALVDGTVVYNTATGGTNLHYVFPGLYQWSGGRWTRLDRDRVFITNTVPIPRGQVTPLVLPIDGHFRLDGVSISLLGDFATPPQVSIDHVESRDGEVRFRVRNLTSGFFGTDYSIGFIIVTTKF